MRGCRDMSHHLSDICGVLLPVFIFDAFASLSPPTVFLWTYGDWTLDGFCRAVQPLTALEGICSTSVASLQLSRDLVLMWR